MRSLATYAAHARAWVLVGCAAVGVGVAAWGCFRQPDTSVVLTNAYAPSLRGSRTIVRAAWQALTFDADLPLVPGASSAPEPTVAATDNTAYVLLAPGWTPVDGGDAGVPTSFVVLRSRSGLTAHFDDTLTIAVDDATFRGDCAGGSPLTQAEADFITQSVFPDVFAGKAYDAANCLTTVAPSASDASAP
jgi:hypothetical protein